MQRASVENLKESVQYLAAKIGPRPASCPALLEKVADFLADMFQSFGYQIEKQPVTGGKHTYFNIIAKLSQNKLFRDKVTCPASLNRLATTRNEKVTQSAVHGSIFSTNKELVIVGAHYDTISRSPGADDNGSGVAGLLEIARLMAGEGLPNLRFVAFCPEEPPAFGTKRMGSYVYARGLKRKRKKIKGMICLEMIGYFDDRPGSQSYPLPFMNCIYPDKGNFIALVGNMRSRRWTHVVKQAFAAGSDVPVESLNSPSIVAGIDYSDHWSFNRFGYSAVMVTDTAFYRSPHYHRYTDTPDTLDYGKMAGVVEGICSALKSGLMLLSS